MTDPTQIQLLRSQGFRLTPQRLAVLRVIENSGRHMLPVEIVQETQGIMPGITEASVYRILDFLTSTGLTLAAHIGSGQLVYETAARAHHHLICRSCGEFVRRGLFDAGSALPGSADLHRLSG